MPSWLWRSVPDEAALAELPEAERYGSEISATQVFDRLAGCWTYWGWKGGYFTSEEDAPAFHDELRFMLAAPDGGAELAAMVQHRPALGLRHRRPGPGPLLRRLRTGELTKSASSYEHPQPHACFIQGVQDDLVNEGGIMDLWVREARLFKYGSGTGSNFSMLRGENEKLSGGGKSSGLMSFLKIGDRAAGAIKSGGTTRRAAKMVIVDIDHPDIEEYIDWKVKEEQKVAALVTGSKIVSKHLNAVMKACTQCEAEGDACFDPERNPGLKKAVKAARKDAVPDNYIQARHPVRPPGLHQDRLPRLRHRLGFRGLPHRRRPELQQLRPLTDDFLRAVEEDADWDLTARTTGKTTKTLKARDLWDKIGDAAWASADPGLHFDTTMNDWHTCPAGGRIRASNPCSEYMFLDDTACNLASATC